MDLAWVRSIEQHSSRAWPAPSVETIHGWEIRATPGARSRRVNAITAMDPIPGRFAAALAVARRRAADRGVPCTVRQTPLAEAETIATLGALGLESSDWTSVQRLAIGGGETPADVVITPSATPVWTAGLAASGTSPDEQALVARLVGAVTLEQGFAVAMDQGHPVAVGRAATDGRLVGIFHVATRPEARGRGHAKRIVSALLAWAADRGTGHAYLQVERKNAPAIAAYARLGFREFYAYGYAVVPASAPDQVP